MSLVLELQRAINSNEKVSKLLTKAYIIAKKLHQQDIIEWLDHEIKGYADKDTLPDYRNILNMRQSITQIEQKIDDNEVPALGNNIITVANSFTGNKFPVQNFIATTDLKQVLTHVQMQILDWVLELELQKVLGEDMTFSEKDEKNAKNITINILGDLNNSPLSTGTDSTQKTNYNTDK